MFNSNATSGLKQPVHEIEIGSASADDWKDCLIHVDVETGLGPFVDVAVLTLSDNDTAPAPEIGDDASISLGFADEPLQLIFSGVVDEILHTLVGRKIITLVNSGSLLSRTRLNQSYEQQSAGDIVSDLLSGAGADTGTIESGIAYPFVVVDDALNLFQHINAFANTCGYLAYVDETNALNFAPFSGEPAVQTFTYGSDILSFEKTVKDATVYCVKVVGDGAAGSEGEDAWPWRVKDLESISATSGAGEIELLMNIPSLTSQDALQQAADSKIEALLSLQQTGRILVPGAPLVLVGKTFDLSDMPDSNDDGTYMARHIQHIFSKYEGYTTKIQFNKVP